MHPLIFALQLAFVWASLVWHLVEAMRSGNPVRGLIAGLGLGGCMTVTAVALGAIAVRQ